MVYHQLLLLLFLVSGLCFGRLFTFVFNGNIAKSTLTLDIGIEGLKGLFFFGIVALVFHFFAPLSSWLFFAIIAVSLIAGLVVLFKERRYIPANNFFLLVILAIIIAPLAGNQQVGYDGGLYHLPHQLWLRTEPLVIGLANFHFRFGFNSLYEYIAAPLWIDNQVYLLSYLQLSFLCYFLVFLVEELKKAEGIHLVLLVGVALNIGLFYDYIYLQSTYTDVPAGILFATTFIYGHRLIYEKESLRKYEWFTFAVLLLSAIFYKVSSLMLILWFFFVVIFRVLKKGDSVKLCVHGCAIPSLLFLIWLFRNVLTTGCLLYPESISCLTVFPWADQQNAFIASQWITGWARFPGPDALSSLTDGAWFRNWWWPQYKSFLINYSLVGAVIGVLYVVLSVLLRRSREMWFDIRIFAGIIFAIIAILFWFWKAPTPRFGIGIFIIFFPIFLMFLLGSIKVENSSSRRMFSLIVVFGILLFACRLSTPWLLINRENLFQFGQVHIAKPQVRENSDYGVTPLKTDQCWLIPECSPYDRPPRTTLFGRAAFLKR